MQHEETATFVIIGGGIAGVSCIETIQYLHPNESIILLTESPLIKTVTNLVPLGKCITRFDIKETDSNALGENVQVITDRMCTIVTKEKTIHTIQNRKIHYNYLCLCNGARPKLIDQATKNPYIIGIRDTESVLQFQSKIKDCTRITIVGNGGIASELVYELRNVQLDWIIKDQFISQTFVDPGAAEFFQSRIKTKATNEREMKSIIKRMRYSEDGMSESSKKGAALGPDWHRKLDLSGRATELPESVQMHYNCEVQNIKQNNLNSGHRLSVCLTNNETIECDLLVSATGVIPCTDFDIDVPLAKGQDGGVLVDELMRTSVPGIFAAGDVCTAGWKTSDDWFQMRLWTQARQMGTMVARGMVAALENEEITQDFCFELFSHVTELFGYQVVLLGKYNGQGLDQNCEILIRSTPEKEYIKYVISNGLVRGAILIGETGLEETSENLILNQIDVTPYGDDLLDPNIDIEDYFD